MCLYIVACYGDLARYLLWYMRMYYISSSFFLLSPQQEAQAQLQQTKSECIDVRYYDDISETINACVQCMYICDRI